MPPPSIYHQQSIPTNPYNSFDTSNNSSCDYMEDRAVQHRRVLRQSTMPNPDVNLYNSNNNLMPPGSPKQQISPQYSPYNTDNEDVDMPNPPVMPARYGIRRQSTLPCPPVAAHFASTSPNRMYSRSPERNDGESTQMPRMAPFVRQSTFPSNVNDPFQQQRPKLLPTSPNRLNNYNKSPEPEMDMQQQQQKRYQVMRQATLPNPDQHMKLLPTSPPKKQLSPQFKRSPEFVRQNTLPNPEGHNQLSIPQQKFLPISPKHKQSFFFPQPSTGNPRTFLSQQNMPTAKEVEQGLVTVVAPHTASPTAIGGSHREHSKMIKVRSHSNEEYSMNRPMEGRRILPEIPRNRSPRYLFVHCVLLFVDGLSCALAL